MAAADFNAYIVPRTGFYAIPVTRDWGDLVASIKQMVDTKLRAVQWVPEGVISQILSLEGAYNGTLNASAILLPANQLTLGTYGRPGFLDTDAKLAWWNDLYAVVQGAYRKAVEGKLAEGRVIMERAQANAEFWKRAYDMWEGVTKPLKNFTKIILLAAVGIGAVMFFTRRR